MAQTEIDLLRSSLDLLIFKALSWGPRHGYAVAEWIESATGDAFAVEEGTLYPALHRLERQQWLAAEWGLSANNRRAKFYSLTPRGRARFRAESRIWHRCTRAVALALDTASPDLAAT